MRIAVLTSLYPSPPRPHEGVFAERRWLGMRARGHEVSVGVPLPFAPPFARGRWAEIAAMPASERRGGVPVGRPRYLHLPGRARANARRFARAGLRALRAGPRPDVVVCDYAWPAAAAAPALAAERIPCVVSGRGSDVLEVAGEAGLGADLALFLRAAGHWCGVSRDLVAAMDALAGLGARGRVVPNGVDRELFRPRPRVPARARLGLPAEPPLVLVAGHLIARKDPLCALEAFAAGAPGDALLAFVGRGPLAGELAARASALGLAARVRLVGEVAAQALADWYAACDLLLLTSHREGRPNVVLEALACGRPVLATDAGGTAELLEPWRARMLAPDHDPARLGALLAALLADPPGPEALAASVAHLSWEASLAALEALLVAAVEGTP